MSYKTNIVSKFGTGLAPKQFIEGMTKNQEEFQTYYNNFEYSREEDREYFESLKLRDDLRVLILAADWCGDVVRNVPVVLQVLATADIPTELLILEENLDVMEQYLTMGGRSVPIVIIADTEGHVLGQWGPRPRHVQEVMEKFKQGNPDREAPDYGEKMAVVREEMKKQYGEGTDYQAVIVTELRDLISGF